MIDYHEVVDVNWAAGGPAGISYTPGKNVYHSELPDAVDLHKTVMKTRTLLSDNNKTMFHLKDQF
jgi:hypothetical protein